MSNITPGPWEVQSDDADFVIADVGGVVVTIADTAPMDGRTAVESLANARAISAVPELIEAANAAIQHMEWSTPQGRAAYEALYAALSKAIGE